ncbi:hypothetical protein F2Q69_00052334 [Brassica cretica]|uniref:Uncharacterized protein n=1 Tax=Brassica cretica TaxID=69181 RepID=A0A8S9MQZ8_BRACR|nr:hypothetical protein F2Q69_00052334 [Brassica cretica]
MAASSSNKNEETDHSKKVNSMDTRKIDDLAAKVDMLLKNNQNQIYVTEETNLEPGTTDAAAETETSEEDQQEVSSVNGKGKLVPKHWISEAILPESESEWEDVHPQPGSESISEPQSNPQAASATVSGPPDELKGMMQQLLKGQQIQGKALNQVTTEINTRMDNMFTELNSIYDAVASHIRQMDVQIAQTAETTKKQQGTLPGKTDKNPKDCNAVELRSGRHLSDPVPKKLTAQEKGKQKEGEQPSLEDVHDDHEPEQPTAA